MGNWIRFTTLWSVVFPALILGQLNALAEGHGGHGGHAAGGELKHGRYIGYIELDSNKNKIAAVSEFYLQSPDDPALFPTLKSSIKMTFGDSHEYLNETYEEVRYDFDNGVLTLDDPKNDLVVTAELHNMSGGVQLMGDVFMRSSSVFGKIFLSFETDEPPDDDEMAPSVAAELDDSEPDPDEGKFITSLDGQYEGECEGEKAVLQVQTVRGLKTIWQGEAESTSLTRDYGVSARIGVKDSKLCDSTNSRPWCSLLNYGGGSYNLLLGKLILRGASSTDECAFSGDTLKCEIRRAGWNRDCRFKKNVIPLKPTKFFKRSFNISPTKDEMKDLPPVNPPKNAELTKALRGSYEGYLHNETNNSYLFMKLNVVPFSFTDNTHNPNRLMITSTATLHLGKDASAPFMTQRFEPRSFYIRPGFTLSGPDTDGFLNISEWKAGFVKGVLYSHAFGRVGTVQLKKGKAPVAPAGTKFVPSFAGEYEGTIAGATSISKSSKRWLRMLFPTQPNDLSENLIRFSGSFNSLVGITTIRNIDRGTFDPYTGHLGWILESNSSATFVNGMIDGSKSANLYWPPAPNVFGVPLDDYKYESFKRK